MASRYLYGYLDATKTDWSRQFGDAWPLVQELKRKHDPHGILEADLFCASVIGV
jgi:hypothetical protein